MRGDENPIAIDIGTRGVKVVQVISRGDRPVEVRRGYGRLPEEFAWEPEGNSLPVERALAAALEQGGARTRHAVCIIPRHQVTLRFSEFPAAARPEDMARMAVLEAEQHIPLPASEMVVGSEVLGPPSSESGLVPVMIAAARRAVIQGYMSVLSAANVQADQITTDTLCLYRMWQKEAADPGSAFIIDLGAHGMVINLIESGLLRLSRAIPGGGDELTRAFQSDFGISFAEAEALKRNEGLNAICDKSTPAITAWLNGIVAEVRRSAMAYTAEAVQPSRLYLCGGGALLAGLDKYLAEATGLRVNLLTPPQNFVPASEGTTFSLAYAASQAASNRPGAMTLLLPEVRAEDRVRGRRRTLTVVGVGAGMALLTFIGGSYGLLQQRTTRLESITPAWKEAQKDIAAAQSLHKKKEALENQLKFLNAAYDTRHSFLDAMLEIHERAPQGIWLTNLVMEKVSEPGKRATYNMEVTGKAPDNEVVADLLITLSKTAGIRNANLGDARSVRFGEKQIVEFNISCQYIEPEEEATEETKQASKGTEEMP